MICLIIYIHTYIDTYIDASKPNLFQFTFRFLVLILKLMLYVCFTLLHVALSIFSIYILGVVCLQ